MDASEILVHDQFYRAVLDRLMDGVYAVDADRRIIYWNRAAEEITDYSREEVIGRRCADNLLMHIDDQGTQLCLGQCPVAQTLSDGQDREACVYLKHRSGYRRPVKVKVAALRDASGAIIGAVEVFSDNQAELQAERTICDLRRALLLDPLTEISNRRHLEMNLYTRMAEKHRYGREFGLLFADIDNFKVVNDSLGHEAGDAVLKMVAGTLVNTSARSDCVGRWGGEEFVCIISCAAAEELHAAGERTRRLVGQSQLEFGGQTIRATISIGGAMASAQDTVETLLDTADRQMYVSKSHGRNCVTIAS